MPSKKSDIEDVYITSMNIRVPFDLRKIVEEYIEEYFPHLEINHVRIDMNDDFWDYTNMDDFWVPVEAETGVA